jgi:peroxiredoxin family protein
MKKKGLVLVIALLCMASLMAAMAYTSAEVKAGYTVRVVNTNEALLALIPNDKDADGTAYVDGNGNLVLDFGRIGNEGNFSGLQPGSTYEWQELVTLKNNSQNKIQVNLTVDGEATEYLTITDSKNKQVKNLMMNQNDKEPLNFKIELPDSVKAGDNLTGKIIVSATSN